MKKRLPGIFFHCYATANDKRLYLKDIQNLVRIKNADHGVGKLILYIAISKVKGLNFFDKLFMNTVKKLFHNHPTIELRSIYFKSNKGRDFSSYASLHRRVKQLASDEDYIFFQNRSAFGPYLDNWLSSFVRQFEKFEHVAVCGSTINFNDHHMRSDDKIPHVQTYAFLTKAKYFNLFGECFPAEDETERLKIILEGEIGLSQYFLQRDMKITCMEWGDRAITNNCKALYDGDIKIAVKGDHQFYHRKYFRRNKLPKVRNPIISPILVYLKAMMQ